jgi:hypothetical protein
MKANLGAFLFALALSLCVALLAVKGDLSLFVSAIPLQTREPESRLQTNDDKFAEIDWLAPGFGGMFIFPVS